MSSLASMKRGLSNASLSGVLGIVLAGCAANPYVKVNSPVADSTVGGPVTIGQAMQYSDATAAEYRAMRSAEFDRQQNVSGTLFGLGAVALGLAAYKAHSDAILGVGLIGATTYQASMWNTSAGRYKLYGEGIDALVCANKVMAPVLVGAAQYDVVGAAMTDVRIKVDAAAGAEGVVYAAMLSQEMPAATRTALQDNLTAARKQLDNANRALARANRYRVLVARAGHTLKVHVDFIREGVDQAVLGTLADPRHLPDAIKRLDDYATFFGTPVPAPVTDAAAAPPAGLKKLDPTVQGGVEAARDGRAVSIDPVAALRKATSELAASLALLNSAYGESDTKKVKKALEGCNLDPASMVTSLQVEPSAIDVTEGEARESDVSVSEGTGFYRVRLLDRADTGIAVTQPDGNFFRVQTTGKSSPGSYRVRVEDNTNAYAIVTVRVNPKGGAPKALTEGSPSAKAAPTCSAKGRSRPEICLAQQVLQVSVTGQFRGETCKAFLANGPTAARGGIFDQFALDAIKKQAGLPANADAAAIKAVMQSPCPDANGHAAAPAAKPAMAPIPAGAVVGCAPVADTGKCSIGGARCQLECAMDTKKLSALAAQLGLAPAPQSFDSILRTRIEAKKKEMKFAPANGDYTPEFAVALDRLK